MSRYTTPGNPYHVALAIGLERVFYYLRDIGDISSKTHVIVEKRGAREDEALELEFRRVCAGNNYLKSNLPFEIVFADKKSNSTGLQMADLIARPVGINIMRLGRRCFLLSSGDERILPPGLPIEWKMRFTC